MKQCVKVKALMKLGGVANKIARRINTGPNAPSAHQYRTFGRPTIYNHHQDNGKS